jgi:hypothetical protein
MSSLALLRLGGLSAVLGGVLFVVVYLTNLFVNLFFSGPDEFSAAAPVVLYIQYAFGLPGQVLLPLGLVGLYSRQSELTGIIGLIGFLMAFVGMFFASTIIWAALVADLGWALFGVSILRAGVYPPAAAILLIVGAVLSGAASALVGSPGSILMGVGAGTESIFSAVMYIGAGGEILLNASIAWLGFALLRSSRRLTP